MHSEDILQAQRHLRGKLLDDPRALPNLPARDLAAQLLLYLDDPAQCWRISAQWLRNVLDADRVDGGFGQPGSTWYTSQNEVLRPNRPVPSVVGIPMNARDAGVATVWAQNRIVVFDDVRQDSRFSPELRAKLLALGTRTKLAVALRNGRQPFGLLCANWLDLKRHTNVQRAVDNMAVLAAMLGPILGAARQLTANATGVAADMPTDRPARQTPTMTRVRATEQSTRSRMPQLTPMPDCAPAHAALAQLTPAELNIARMAASGMSYKEIARILDRSFSTVDHHLRSVRNKLDVTSTPKLVRVLTGLLPNGTGAGRKRQLTFPTSTRSTH